MAVTRNILLTVTPFLDYAGSIPHEYVSRYLARQLVKEGYNVRILAEKSLAQDWPKEAEIVTGDIRKPSETPEIFKDIDAVFLAGAVPETIYEALEMAKEAGVKKIVDLSSHGPEVEVMFTPDSWYWLAIEVVVERSGIHYTHVVPSNLMVSTLVGDHYSAGKSIASRVRNDEVIQEPYLDAQFPLIHEEDLAAIVAKELHDIDTTGKTLHAYGPLINDRERVRILKDVLGKPVKFKELTPEEAAEHYRREGWEEDNISHVLGIKKSMLENPIRVNPEIEKLIGRPLKTYDQWVHEHIEYFSD